MRVFAVVFVFQVILNCFYFLTPKQNCRSGKDRQLSALEFSNCRKIPALEEKSYFSTKMALFLSQILDCSFKKFWVEVLETSYPKFLPKNFDLCASNESLKMMLID